MSVHDWHHELIADRVAAANGGFSGVHRRHQHREAVKRAVWTLRDHLSSEHGRVVGAVADFDVLHAAHVEAHEATS